LKASIAAARNEIALETAAIVVIAATGGELLPRRLRWRASAVELRAAVRTIVM